LKLETNSNLYEMQKPSCYFYRTINEYKEYLKGRVFQESILHSSSAFHSHGAAPTISTARPMPSTTNPGHNYATNANIIALRDEFNNKFSHLNDLPSGTRRAFPCAVHVS
jgi:hypothetical protein